MSDIPEILASRVNQSQSLSYAYSHLSEFLKSLSIDGGDALEACLKAMEESSKLLMKLKFKGEFVDDGFTMQRINQIKAQDASGHSSGLDLFRVLTEVASAFDSGHIEALSEEAKEAYDLLLMSGLVLAISSLQEVEGGNYAR